jgi:hypothetical protein
MLELLQSKLRFGIFVILVSVCSGCASQKIGLDDLRQYRTNCNDRVNQVTFLNQISYTKDDQLVAAIQLLIMGPFTPDYELKKEIAGGSAQFMIDGIKQEYTKCRS